MLLPGEAMPLILSREDFFRWTETQPPGKYERVFGRVVGVAPERRNHNRLKGAIYRALEDAAAELKPPAPDLEVTLHGMTVSVGDNDFEPDVTVHQGPPISPNAITVPNPVIIVEDLSPSTARIDSTIKLEAYFRLDGLAHYLLFRSDRRTVTQFQRGGELARHPFIGPLTLDPPGLTIDLKSIYDRAGIG